MSKSQVRDYVLQYHHDHSRSALGIAAQTGAKALFVAGSSKVAGVVGKKVAKATGKQALKFLGGYVFLGLTAIEIASQYFKDVCDEADFMFLDQETLGSALQYIPDKQASRIVDVMSEIGEKWNCDALRHRNGQSFMAYCRQVSERDNDICTLLNAMCTDATFPTTGVFAWKRYDYKDAKVIPIPCAKTSIKTINRDYCNLACFILGLTGNMGYLSFIGDFSRDGFYDPDDDDTYLAAVTPGAFRMEARHKSYMTPLYIQNVLSTMLIVSLAGFGVVPCLVSDDGIEVVRIDDLMQTYTGNSWTVEALKKTAYSGSNIFNGSIALAQISYKTLKPERGEGKITDLITLCNYAEVVKDQIESYPEFRSVKWD